MAKLKLKKNKKFSFKNPLKHQKRDLLEPWDPREHGVSVSCLQGWLSCREASRVKYVLGYRPLLEKIPFVQGSTYHAGMEGLIRAIKNGDDPMIEASSGMVKEVATIKKKNPGSTVIADACQEAYDNVQALFPEYLHHYDEDLEKDWREVEGEFRVDVKVSKGVVIPFIGKIDAGYDDNGLMLMEHKFLSRVSDGKIDSLPLDLQVNGYVSARDAKGVTYNIIRKPGLRKKQGESLSEFHRRVQEDIRKRPNWYFERHDIEFTKEDVQAAKDRLKTLLYEFYQWWLNAPRELEQKDHLRNAGNCENKYGMCECLDVCINNDTTMFRQNRRVAN